MFSATKVYVIIEKAFDENNNSWCETEVDIYSEKNKEFAEEDLRLLQKFATDCNYYMIEKEMY